MTPKTPEMDILGISRNGYKKSGQNNVFSMFFGRFGPLPKIPKEFKGNQRESKGNVKGNQRKFLKFSILRFGKCLKNVQAYLKFRKLLFFNQIFF